MSQPKVRSTVDQAALVGPDLPDPGVAEPRPQQRPLRAVAVLDARRDDVNGQEHAQGVGDDEPLAALDLLARVEAPGGGGDGIRGADGLGVDQARARLRAAAVGFTDLAAQGVMDALDGAVVVPPSEVLVHRRPRREVLRQLPPGTPGPHHVEDRVEDPPPRVLLPSTTFRTHPRWWEQQLHQCPLVIRQVRRIPTPDTARRELNERLSNEKRQISNTV